MEQAPRPDVNRGLRRDDLRATAVYSSTDGQTPGDILCNICFIDEDEAKALDANTYSFAQRESRGGAPCTSRNTTAEGR